MQDFRQLAAKNGLKIAETGPCQLCSAGVERGVEECLRVFGDLAGLLRYEKEYARAHLFSVDAHALQHSEVHGVLNNHVHLLGLCLMLERGASAAMGTRKPAVEKFLALGREWPALPAPPMGERGTLTALDVARASATQRPALARRWAEEVWDAYRVHQPWVRRTLDRLAHD